MNSNLFFDFSVDKENKAIHVKREFAAKLNLVWDAWTKPEILELWWAPKPYRTKTKSMDFKIGGFWLYAMISPEDVAHWCRADYKSIEHLESFSALDAFCDEEGNMNTEVPRSLWNNQFEVKGESTIVNIKISYDSLEDLEKIVEMGFKDGFTMALGNLDDYFSNQKNN